MKELRSSGEGAEKALRLSQAHLARILDIADDAIISVNEAQRITLFNQGAERIFGYQAQEVIGRSLDLLLPPAVAAAHRQHIVKFAYASESARRMGERREIFGRRKDGTEFPAEASISKLEMEGEQIFTVILRDITERKKAEQQQAELVREQAARAEAERTAETIRRLQALTEAALAHLSLEALLSELLGRIRELLHVDTVAILLMEEETRSLVARAAKGLEEEVARGVRIPFGKGFAGRIAAERRPVVVDDVNHAEILNPLLRERGIRSLMGAPLLVEGRVLGVVHVGTLLPRRFTTEDINLLQLVADRTALAIDHARLYDAERRARTEAEQANRIKDEFLATVSHELRTPLTAILGWVHLLRGDTLDEAGVGRALETIERNAKAQAQIVNDILDVSRVITGKFHLNVEQVNPAVIVQVALDAVRPAVEAKGVRLDVEVDPEVGLVSGDPDRLQQVIWNLLSNAIKFNDAGGHIRVRLERADPHVRLSVSDTGQGISPEFLPYVFDRFRQADSSSTRTHGGLGLGLAIVRHIVELHGGMVRAESRGAGQGATFTVDLPLRAVRQAAGAGWLQGAGQSRPGEHAGALKGLRVVVVDDDPDARELIATILEQYGARALTFASARDALASLDQARPDILVSDIGMPDEDGYDLIRQVRARELERGGRLPALALTAYAGGKDRLQALAAGFQMHMAKPVEPGTLVKAVATLCRG